MFIYASAWLCTTIALILAMLVVTNDASSPAQNVHDSHVIYFLFIETSEQFNNADIWSDYFGSTNSAYFHISIHANSPGTYKYPGSLKYTKIGPKQDKGNTTEEASCSKKASIVQHMLATTLAHTRSPEDKIILLSSETIPIKSFRDLRASLYPHYRVHNPESRLCLFPPESWEKHAELKNQRLVKHHEWAILSRPHAQTVLDAYIAHHGRIEDNYPLLHTLDITQPRCRHHYFLFYALYGDVDLSADSSLHSHVHQPCFMYDAANTPEDNIPHLLSPSVPTMTNGTITTVKYTWLKELVKQPDLYFARQFANSVSVRTDKDDVSPITLKQSLQQLGVINNNNTVDSPHILPSLPAASSGTVQRNWNFSFDPIDRTEQFQKLKGDNTGLRVLVVTVDDRIVGDNFEGADYVSLTAVLRHNYCKKHNYGYISFRTDSAALLKGVKERYPEDLKVSDSTIGATKYGYANFHPGLKQFRSAGFGKLPALWYLHQRYGSLFDYIWFQDSDSAINPARDTRSVGDAMREWRESNVTGVVRGVADPRDATFLFFNNFPWREDMPCSGNFLIKTNLQAEVMLREWWDYDLPQKNFVDFMEQDSMWYALEAPAEMKFEMNFQHTVSLLYEQQFPSQWHGVNDLWAVHIANYDQSHRTVYFQNM